MLTKKEIEDALLKEFGVEHRQIKKFAKLVREHLYGRSLIVKEGKKICPFLEHYIEDRCFLDLLKQLEIYDFQIEGYFEKTWSFVIVFNNRFTKHIKIGKHAFPEPLEFHYATAVSLLFGLRAHKENKENELKRQIEINDFIEY